MMMMVKMILDRKRRVGGEKQQQQQEQVTWHNMLDDEEAPNPNEGNKEEMDSSATLVMKNKIQKIQEGRGFQGEKRTKWDIH